MFPVLKGAAVNGGRRNLGHGVNGGHRTNKVICAFSLFADFHC